MLSRNRKLMNLQRFMVQSKHIIHVRWKKIMKYGKMITGLILLALLVSCMGVLNAIDPKDNVTVTMDGVSFDAPRTSNNTTDFTKTPTGGITWAYEDYEHGLSVYVSDMGGCFS